MHILCETLLRIHAPDLPVFCAVLYDKIIISKQNILGTVRVSKQFWFAVNMNIVAPSVFQCL